jgi:hypothetical protein
MDGGRSPARAQAGRLGPSTPPAPAPVPGDPTVPRGPSSPDWHRQLRGPRGALRGARACMRPLPSVPSWQGALCFWQLRRTPITPGPLLRPTLSPVLPATASPTARGGPAPLLDERGRGRRAASGILGGAHARASLQGAELHTAMKASWQRSHRSVGKGTGGGGVLPARAHCVYWTQCGRAAAAAVTLQLPRPEAARPLLCRRCARLPQAIQRGALCGGKRLALPVRWVVSKRREERRGGKTRRGGGARARRRYILLHGCSLLQGRARPHGGALGGPALAGAARPGLTHRL